MLWVYRSNRLETLAEVLAEKLAEERPHPLQRQSIVVQGSGVDRFLAQTLAKHFGIWANADFPFPRKFFENLFAQAGVPPVEGRDPYGLPDLAFAIAELLPDLLQRPTFAPLRHYVSALAGRASSAQTPLDLPSLGREHVALAHRLARLFDRYMVYRADLLHAWDHGHGADDWQAELWRALTRRISTPHFPRRAKQWVERLDTPSTAVPQRAYVFGLFHLPPLYVELLGQLARRCEVFLFFLNPSPEYWAEIRSRRQILRDRRERFGTLEELETVFEQTIGNPLLASFGRPGRDLQALLESLVDYRGDDLYEDPGEDSLLHLLQADMFALRRRAPDNTEAGPISLSRTDRSVQVHNCHSPMREVEVLHDVLRDALEGDPSLRPEDCLVLCTDISLYAPLIDAVFAAPQLGDKAIPFHVADRPLRTSDELVDCLFAALELLGGRAPVSAVLSLLAREPVRRRFKLTQSDLDRLHRWVEELHVHWGLDADHREAEGLPRLPEHTWQFATDRLLVGAALPFDEKELYRGVCPFDVEGDAAELAGKLAEFCERLRTLRLAAQGARPVAEWGTLVAELCRQLFAVEEYPDTDRAIREQLNVLREAAETAGLTRPVELEAIADQLAVLLEERARPYGFLAGGVNVCALRATRCIPARVVCVLGLSDGAFPRGELPLPEDRIVQQPRTGDPNPREEDRYNVLLALLSARDRFVVTYCGQDLFNNAPVPPATVLEELLDIIDDSATTEDGRKARHQVIVRHSLHPFHRQYFQETRGPLFSFSRSYCEAARHSLQPRQAPSPWFRGELPPWSGESVTLTQLVEFFRHPQRQLLRMRLRVPVREDGPADLDTEPLELDALEQWEVATFLLDCLLDERPRDPDDTLEHARARGLLPPGKLGRFAWQELIAPAATIAEVVKRLCGKTLPYKVDFSLPVDPGSAGATRLQLSGELRALWPAAQVLWTYSKIERFQELHAWILHLLLCALDDRKSLESTGQHHFPLPRTTILVGRSEEEKGEVACRRFLPCSTEEARERLRELIDLFLLGLRAPLAFVPEASRAYARAIREGRDTEEALRRAETALRPPWSSGNGGAKDAAWILLYGTAKPRIEDLDRSRPAQSPCFQELAQALFFPLWERLGKGKQS